MQCNGRAWRAECEAAEHVALVLGTAREPRDSVVRVDPTADKCTTMNTRTVLDSTRLTRGPNSRRRGEARRAYERSSTVLEGTPRADCPASSCGGGRRLSGLRGYRWRVGGLQVARHREVAELVEEERVARVRRRATAFVRVRCRALERHAQTLHDSHAALRHTRTHAGLI